MRLFLLTAVLLGMLIALAGCASKPEAQAMKLADLAYGPGERNQLDLYLPADTVGAPVVVFVHGGRWFRNDKSQIELYGRHEALTEAGFVVAAINYSYSSQALWPAQLEDTLAAIDYVRQRAGEFGYDADRLGIWGQSSGAQIALMATIELSRQQEHPAGALVSWYAPSDLLSIKADRENDSVPGGNENFPDPRPETLLLGASVEEDPARAALASPVAQIRLLDPEIGLPALLLVHGDADAVVSPLQTERLYTAIRERRAGDAVELRVVAGGGHGGEAFHAEAKAAIDFLSRQLGAGNPE